ncbi:MAG: sensory rhodopsin transducer [Actinobacteria bacterium]|nr:sensory rhodopsin transducer [Actinomycetota bacterium]
MNEIKNSDGSRTWYIADGWLPSKNKEKGANLEGHEALMALNCNKDEAKIKISVFFEDKDPIENISLIVPPRRIKCFRLDRPEDFGGFKLKRLSQYALKIESNIEVIVQYGRMDVTQPNLAYIGLMAYPGNG